MTVKKRCAKCGIDKPVTAEYFYRRSRNKDGLDTICKDCIKGYQQIYYAKHGRTKRKEVVPTPPHAGDDRRSVLSKYKEGQIIKINFRENKGTPWHKKKIEIIKFFPKFALCDMGGYKESFAYRDLIQLTRK